MSFKNRTISALITSVSLLLIPSMLLAAGSVVKVSKDSTGKFILLRDGKPFFINGSGGTQRLTELVQYGGNSVRTWGIDSLDELVDGKPLADRAQELGIGVTAGIWIGHERHGFNYSDPKQLEAQRQKVRDAVKKWKDHPALLIWGLGNEMEGPASDGADPRIWKELNTLAGIIKEMDPNHPVMTVIASSSPTKVKAILQYYPNIDILGVNAYSGASGAGKAVKEAGWNKPFILTEFGPPGQWEVRKTSWGAPIEPTSWDKAGTYFATYSLLMQNTKDICLGSYVFLWGSKQEATSTWYGMFLKTGEKMPTVDAMARAWNGKWPAVRSPKILSFKTDLAENKVPAGKTFTASAEGK
ncbi:MAG: glycoside hydrolase family 2 TIM barrel-domain containing protein, partial [Verrucomicrobiota bacterium]